MTNKTPPKRLDPQDVNSHLTCIGDDYSQKVERELKGHIEALELEIAQLRGDLRRADILVADAHRDSATKDAAIEELADTLECLWLATTGRPDLYPRIKRVLALAGRIMA